MIILQSNPPQLILDGTKPSNVERVVLSWSYGLPLSRNVRRATPREFDRAWAWMFEGKKLWVTNAVRRRALAYRRAGASCDEAVDATMIEICALL